MLAPSVQRISSSSRRAHILRTDFQRFTLFPDLQISIRNTAHAVLITGISLCRSTEMDTAYAIQGSIHRFAFHMGCHFADTLVHNL